MIDRVALLSSLKPIVTLLENDIRERTLAVPDLAQHLELEHTRAIAAQRTAMSLPEWRDGEITQAAVAWVLACVFVRFIEDNGLVERPLISGRGHRRAAALGRREEHFRAHPDHSDREYLEDCFRTVAAFPAVAPLYDERHNPLWHLGPSADGARLLREAFTAIVPDSGELIHDFADPELGTRFLGDLYQDLSDAAKKRYALLQTPDFVERFILDRTLEPAIDEFGLEEVRLIDPTCGSGHFLIAAFRRLIAKWQDREPGTPVTVLAQRSLDAVHGVDLNPYATAIARFRLVVAALNACGVDRLAEAPAFQLHLATGDSLLHGPLPADGATMLFDANRLRQNIDHVFETEDASELRHILGQGYHAVVGNPPYIAVADSALRDAYRSRYASCHGQYVLTVPFMERFFELARVDGVDGRIASGFVGKITGNSFMKREFGAPLVEKFLPSVDVQTVVDTSGAYIPGHGTPTIMLFGRSRPPMGSTLRVVDGISGEPSQPADPSRGLVWSSIESLIDLPGEQNKYVRASDVRRAELSKHPMTLGIGRDLRRRLEASASATVANFDPAPGFMAMSHADEAFDRPLRAWSRGALEEGHVLPVISGDGVRDWLSEVREWSFFSGRAEPGRHTVRELWRLRTELWNRSVFGGGTYRTAGRPWWEWHQFAQRRLGGGMLIAWAEVATHNHFVLDRGGKVFKQTAPVIQLPEGSTEDDHLALLATLNSSAACFWLKQVCQPKGAHLAQTRTREERFAFNAENVKDIPVPSDRQSQLPAALDSLARERAHLLESLRDLSSDASLPDHLAACHVRDQELTARMISLQEEVDWQVLAAFGIVDEDLQVLGVDAPPISLGERAFEIVLARQIAAGETESTWFERHGSTPVTAARAEWPTEYRAVVDRRIALIEGDTDIGLLERPAHKRRWVRQPWEDRQREALKTVVLDELETPTLWADLRLRSTAELTDHLRAQPRMVEALELLADRKDADLAATVRGLVINSAVAHPAALRLTDAGLRKRAVWEQVWELQRQEDRIEERVDLEEGHAARLNKAEAERMKLEEVGTIPVLPRYAQADFRTADYWKLRGKLDVSGERFTLIPGAERSADNSPVVGWAGWDERDLARGLAGRITELREHEAADADGLVPLLAGVLELLPWIHQWHPESDALYGGPPGRYFEDWLDGQLVELGVTREALRAWRPPPAIRGRRARATIS